jgi:peptidoglycan hydrolase CwlO-like protein
MMERHEMTQKFDVVAWFADRGIPGYANEINQIENTINEVRGEAGRYGDQCPFTQERIEGLRKQIEEVRQSAEERYGGYAE